MSDTGLDVVTGAFSYTGRYIAASLLDRGRAVRTLTGHPTREGADERIDARPYRFDSPSALARTLEGATTLYNTYWVRFERGGTTFAQAVENSKRLFAAARKAAVRRVVHVSITNPVLDSRLPYFRGKAQVERALRRSTLPHAIVRPTVVFGREDILINNIAWLLRRLPVFAIPGDGGYRVRPVHVEDVARLCVETEGDDVVVDAVGPETFRFVDMIRLIREAVGSRALLLNVPPLAVPPMTWALGTALRDTLLTPDELRGLIAELVTTDGRATGRVSLSAWVREHADDLGRAYASEVGRHFDVRDRD